MRNSLICSAIVATVATSFSAVAGPVSVAAPSASSPYALAASYRETLLGIRTAALRQQARDGGTLTKEHRAAFQTQLDRLSEHHRRLVANANPLSVDAFGHSIQARQTDYDWPNSNLIKVGTSR